MAKPIRIQTIGDLRSAIRDLPDDTPVHSKGNDGGWPQGTIISIKPLARATIEPNYIADPSERIWFKVKGKFDISFTAVIFG